MKATVFATPAELNSISDSLPFKGISINIFSNRIIEGDSGSITIPFNKIGNLILVKAQADSIEGNFILDTGCPYLVLNLTYFRDYATTAPAEERSGITGSQITAAQTEIAEFSLGPKTYYRTTADLVNLGNIENVKGVKILGLIGMKMLDRFEMIVDYENNLIHLREVKRKEASIYKHAMLTDVTAYTVIPFELTKGRIIVKTVIGGKKVRLLIDSGAESNIIDSRLPNKVFDMISITGRIILSGAGNAKTEVLKGDLSGLSIGDTKFATLPVIVANLEKTCLSHAGCVDGILGFDFLSLKKIGFNFVTYKMYIWK